MRRAILEAMAAFVFCAPGWAGDIKLPEGEGKQVIEQVCSACHGIETAVGGRHDKTGWQKVVDDMVAWGADATEEQLKTIVEYLTKYFGPKASAAK
jgi:cytochrome c5